ncbi:MAG: glycosyltransferase family 39 protein [Chloroflexota bacterium]|nr:glycosyltransferase family 39 protein [Chloroflexota bacterium]
MRLSRNQVAWLTIGVVAWIFLTLALFYWVQKPLEPENAAALGRAALDLGAAVLIGAAGLALGSWLLGRLRLERLSRGDRVVLGTGLGLGLLGLILLGLGTLGILSRWTFLGLLATLLLLLRRALSDAIPLSFLHSQLSTLHPPLIYIGFTLLLALLAALTPPTSWDGLFYHLTGPAWALDVGRIGPPPANLPHLSFPGLMESLFSLAMALRGDVAAKLLHWGFALLLGGLVYRLTVRHVNARLGWGAVVALYATPMVAVLAGWAYNDLALAFFQVAALYAVLNGLEENQPSLCSLRWFGVAGGLAGFAMGLKYTSFICPVTLVVLILWGACHEKASFSRKTRFPQLKQACGHAALFILAALVVASPWYLRNLVFTGNPVYPFAYTLWDGPGWSQWHADWYAQAGTGLGGDVGALLTLPVMLTLGLRDMNYFDGRTGPLFLVALPALLAVALFDRRKPRALTALLWFGLAQYFVWVLGVASSRSLFQSRLLLTGLVTLCPALAYVYDSLRRFDRPGFSLHRFVGLALTLVLLFNVVYQALDLIRLRPLPYLVGQESREEFLTRRLGGYYLAMQAVADLPDDARVQFLWEPRSYYSGRVVQPDSILETWKYLCDRHHRDTGAIAADLRGQDVTHLLLHVTGMNLVAQETPAHLTPADVAAWNTLRTEYLDVVWELPGAYELYTWR